MSGAVFSRDVRRDGSAEPTALDWRAKAAIAPLCALAAEMGQPIHVCVRPGGDGVEFSAFSVDHAVSCSLRAVEEGGLEEVRIG